MASGEVNQFKAFNEEEGSEAGLDHEKHGRPKSGDAMDADEEEGGASSPNLLAILQLQSQVITLQSNYNLTYPFKSNHIYVFRITML